jgi:hypothetical protein
MIFYTCCAISARTNRASPVSIDCKFRSRVSTNRLGSRDLETDFDAANELYKLLRSL